MSNKLTPTALEKTELSKGVRKFKSISFILMAFMLLMLFLPWEQTTNGAAKLIPYNPNERDYTIDAPISGYIKNYYVKEDEFVKKGDLLLEMQDLDKEYLPKLKDIQSDIEIQKSNALHSLTILKEQEHNLKENLQTGLQIHTKKIDQTKDTIATLKNRKTEVKNSYQVAKSNYERIKTLYSEGIESKRSYELAHNEYIRVKALLDTTLINIQRETKSLEIAQKEKESFLKSQQNRIKSMQNQIITAQNSLKTFDLAITNSSINVSRNATAKLYASRDGYPLRILKNDADSYIKQGEALIHFAPKVTKRVLLVKIRAIDMPLIKKGLKVRIQFFGWPSLQVSGWPKITYGTFGGIVDKLDPIAHEEGVFYAYITQDPNDPWPDAEVLKVGTKANAWIRLSTVAIGYEMWRLHNALPLKMINAEEK